MKKVYVLELSSAFNEPNGLIDIRLEDVNTGQEYGFSTLSEFQRWLHIVATQDSRRKRTRRQSASKDPN